MRKKIIKISLAVSAIIFLLAVSCIDSMPYLMFAISTVSISWIGLVMYATDYNERKKIEKRRNR